MRARLGADGRHLRSGRAETRAYGRRGLAVHPRGVPESRHAFVRFVARRPFRRGGNIARRSRVRTCTPASTPGHLGDVLSMICETIRGDRLSDGVTRVAAAGVALGTFGRGTRLPRRADSPSAPKDGPRACSRR
jgi:hypothetical protein